MCPASSAFLKPANTAQRDRLWFTCPYPCVGKFKFLTLNLPSHPKYSHLLSMLCNSQTENSSPPIQLLDLGCCVAQELRSLAYAGIPSPQLYGSDLNPDFLTISYTLFNDQVSFKGTLVSANVFDETIFDNSWKGWEQKFGVIHAGLFLHLFDWDQQLVVCEKIVKLMSKEKGSLFLGEMVGCEGGTESGQGKANEEKKQYLHNKETFERMWGEVAKKTGTVGMWKVEGAFKKAQKERAREGSTENSFFTGEGVGWLTFSVEMI